MESHAILKASLQRIDREALARAGPIVSSSDLKESWSAEIMRFFTVRSLVINPEFVGASDEDTGVVQPPASAAAQPAAAASAAGGAMAGAAPTEEIFKGLLRPDGYSAANYSGMMWGRFPAGAYLFSKQTMSKQNHSTDCCLSSHTDLCASVVCFITGCSDHIRQWFQRSGHRPRESDDGARRSQTLQSHHRQSSEYHRPTTRRCAAQKRVRTDARPHPQTGRSDACGLDR